MEHQLARTAPGKIVQAHVTSLQKKLASGSGFDLTHEFKTMWGSCWQQAIDEGVNPKAVGTHILGAYYRWVTDNEPDYGQLGRLVGLFGKASLLGLTEAVGRGIEPPYRYAFAICKSKAQEARSDNHSREAVQGRPVRERVADTSQALPWGR